MNIIYPVRINRYLALNNYATRTGADELIKKGFVIINGRKAVLGDQVYRDDKVEVKSSAPKKEYVYYAYNKPVGISTNPEIGSKDILKAVKFPERVFPIGRLDKDSHGLIIMSNDGRITDRLLSPKYVHEKEYVVKTESAFTDKFLENIQNGVKFDGFVSKKCQAWTCPPSRELGSRRGFKKNIFHIVITEGKKRQIRRMCEALYHKVVDLKRVRIMNIQLGKINENTFRKIEGKELEDFLKLLNII